MRRKSTLIGLLVVLVLAVVLMGCWGLEPTPEPTVSPISPCPTCEVDEVIGDEVVALGMTNLTGLQIQGAETDALVVDQTSTGDIVEFRDNGTVVWRLADGGTVTQGGAISMEGEQLDLDADNDTSFTADTDDQIDVEIGGADLVVFKDFGTGTIATTTTEHLVEIQDSTRVVSTSGTVVQSALNIDLGIGNSTAGTSSVYGILIDGISADAQNTETGIQIGSGWDRGIDLDGNDLYMDDDQDTYFHESSDDVVDFVPGAATGDLRIEVGNLRIGAGSPGDASMDGDDLYVEGESEFDGASYFDGAVDMDSTLTLAADVENFIAPSVAIASATWVTSAGGTGTVATIGANEVWLIWGCYAHVTTNWDATAGDDASLEVGDGNDVDGLLDLDDAELQTTDTEGTGGEAGWQGFFSTDTRGAYLTSTPFLYAPGSEETIDWTASATGDDLTAGAATIYLVYSRIQ